MNIEEKYDKIFKYYYMKTKIKNFSEGMKQRLKIAQAILNDPKIVIFDGPTAGLDPKERVRFRNIIKELGKDNIASLSTHIVSDIEKIAFDGNEEKQETCLPYINMN